MSKKAKKFIAEQDEIDYIPSQKQGNYLISEKQLIDLLDEFGKMRYKKGMLDGYLITKS